MTGKVLVTGGSGFVGSAVVRHLLKQGYAVRVLVRPASDRTNISQLSVEIATGDLLNPDSLEDALHGCDGLFHVAADYRLWAPNPALMYRVNVNGTVNLMEAALAASIKRIVYTSSVAVLGHTKDNEPIDETAAPQLEDMIGDYKRSKYLAEKAVQDLIEKRQLPAVIVNPSTPVGPRDVKPTPTGRMVLQAAERWTPIVIATGLNLVHVDDVASGHRLAYERGKIGHRYILGGDNLPLREIFSRIAKIAGHSPPLGSVPPMTLAPLAWVAEAWCRWRHSGVPLVTRAELAMARKPMYFDSSRAERELGYRHRSSELALADALRWAQSAGQIRAALPLIGLNSSENADKEAS